MAGNKVLPVILAGGSGTRLWPLSRELHPKQFLNLVGDKTLLQQTLARLDGLSREAPVIVCNHEHRFIVAEQCRQAGLEPGAIILEPTARNTAPALALAALRAVEDGDDPLLLVLPADHFVGSATGFRAAVERAAPFAEAGGIVTFGIVPSRPDTGYGYIRAGEPTAVQGVDRVAAFVEKPASDTARQYLAAGGYYWNSGMFLMKAGVYLEELRSFRPDIVAACAAATAARRMDLERFYRPGEAFRDCPADSIDYAVMERTQRALVVAADMDWTDLGSWSALAGRLAHDAAGNTTRGDVVAVDTRNCHLSGSDRLVAAIGLDGVVVVETPDAVLVADKGRAQDVKKIVERLRRGNRDEHRLHTTVYRPWGHAETFKAGPGFLVKRITVAPGEALSLQMHRHRAEHWVVVRGEAAVQRDDEQFVLAADESTYIPVGARHRLANPGPAPLHLIEVQVGRHLSEDDIVRFDDRYGRE